MRGYLSIEKRTSPTDIILGPDGVRGLAVCLAAGLVAGCLAASLRFHLGLPGHKALLWMTPVIAGRLLGRCTVGAGTGALTAAFISIGLGGSLAGGPMGWPLVAAAGALIDASIVWLERHKVPPLTAIMVVALSAMLANLLCCAKRLLAPAGIAPHDVLAGAGVFLCLMSYGLFGFLAGLIAATAAHFVRRRSMPRKSVLITRTGRRQNARSRRTRFLTLFEEWVR